jgi:hypothetical protein
MAKDTPSMAKNGMKRCFAAILDPLPSSSDIDRLWEHFESSCTYCGVKLDRNARTGHIDHLKSTASGGVNNIHNHALSCGRCNGDEKREESWQTFLIRKATGAELQRRRARIEEWLIQSPKITKFNPQVTAEIEAITKGAFKSFDTAVERLREIRRRAGS